MFKDFIGLVIKVVATLAVMFAFSIGLCAIRDWSMGIEVDWKAILRDYQPIEEICEEEDVNDDSSFYFSRIQQIVL